MTHIKFKHTAARADELLDVADRHGVDVVGGRTTQEENVYVLHVSGATEAFITEVARLPYVEVLEEI